MVTILDANLDFQNNYEIRAGKPTGVVLHHAAAKSASVETIHSWHLGNGWAGIGYHFYVRKDGKVYRGRPENWIGAHTVGKNDAIGVCAEGNFETESMPKAQQQAIVEVLRYLYEKYGVLTVTRHGDWYATACPGEKYPFDAIVAASKASAVAPTVPSSENRVLAFQKAALADGVRLPQYGADGIWGDETANATEVLLANGSTGVRVRLLQTWLGGLATDGIFGDKTESAVKAYQRKHGLDADGLVGKKTWAALLGV